MSVSERIQNVQFPKGIAGYQAKEVDAFLDALLPIVQEQEQLIFALRAKLDAFEKRSAELAAQEKEALRVLESARAEAEGILAEAEKKADGICRAAEQDAAVKLQIASTNAQQKEEAAAVKARDQVETAKKNAETILAAADRKGKALLAEASKVLAEETQKAKVLAAECTVFESHFRTLVADTVRSLTKLQEDAPKVPDAPIAVPETAAPQKAETQPEEPVAPAVPTAQEETEMRDFAFAGGKPLASREKTGEMPRRKLYDTVTVTYEQEDGFADIRKLKEESSAKQRKSPTHFSE